VLNAECRSVLPLISLIRAIEIIGRTYNLFAEGLHTRRSRISNPLLFLPWNELATAIANSCGFRRIRFCSAYGRL